MDKSVICQQGSGERFGHISGLESAARNRTSNDDHDFFMKKYIPQCQVIFLMTKMKKSCSKSQNNNMSYNR